jgi:hypothetical protein
VTESVEKGHRSNTLGARIVCAVAAALRKRAAGPGGSGFGADAG